MATVPQINIHVPKRVPFNDTIPLVGANYSGAALVMHVRNFYGDTGTPVIALGALSGGEGLSVTYDAAYPFTDQSGAAVTEPASIFRIQILEATLEALDLATPPDKAAQLVYDIHVTPSGGDKFVLCGGQFLITPGSTI